MNASYFITGTDTSVGKTWVTVALMRYFKKREFSVIAMKPVAAGCEWHNGQLKNEDALLLQANASIALQYKQVNPYAFERPASPHLVAQGNPVSLEVLVKQFDNLKKQAEIILVEGAGGWMVPLNNTIDISDLANTLNIPVIMVVAIRLGCINHARLTFQAIQMSGVECAGWIAVIIDPGLLHLEENIQTLKGKISAPLIGVMPYTLDGDFDLLADNISL